MNICTCTCMYYDHVVDFWCSAFVYKILVVSILPHWEKYINSKCEHTWTHHHITCKYPEGGMLYTHIHCTCVHFKNENVQYFGRLVVHKTVDNIKL